MMDHQAPERAPEQVAKLSREPSERMDNWHSTFWFEHVEPDLQDLIEKVGEDDALLETDFPHPTCLHLDPLGAAESHLGSLKPQTRRKVLGENAATLCRVQTPELGRSALTRARSAQGGTAGTSEASGDL